MARTLIIFLLLVACGGLLAAEEAKPSVAPSSAAPLKPLSAKAAEVVDQELETFVQPKVKITLLRSADLRPVSAVLLNDELYFTNGIGNSKHCLGKHLYREKISGRRIHRVANVPCVIKVMSDGKDVFLLAGDENNAKVRDLYQLVNNTIVEDKRLAHNRSWYPTCIQVPAAGQGFMIIYNQCPAPEPDHLSLYATGAEVSAAWLPNLQNVIDVAYSTFYRQLFVLFGNDCFPKVAILTIDNNGKVVGHSGLGTNQPLPDWLDVAPERCSIRQPRYLLSTERGFVIADRTTFAREVKSIQYFSVAKARVYRVGVDRYKERISGDDVGGLFIVRQGILIARPELGRVEWYGTENRFDKNEVLSEDLEGL
ncbi:MAG: hypothetical protein HY537_16940 [Deltaproteobacteria bacterium]|nr:hypothetical protein [Deltaproteobacteria bacterium]